MKLDLRKPCNDCPFRRRSVPGWLGPWEPEELLFSLGREEFPCHQTIKGTLGETTADAHLQGCAGAAIFLNNKTETSRHPVTQEHQQLCRTIDPAVTATVFATGQEFREHHARRNRKSRLGGCS